MVIDFDYILKRIDFLINENLSHQKIAPKKLPKMVRYLRSTFVWKVIYRPTRYVYLMLNLMRNRNKSTEYAQIYPLHPLALNFMKYFFEILPMIKSVCPDYKFKYMDIYPSNTIADKIMIGFV
jgi:hypothetical protein